MTSLHTFSCFVALASSLVAISPAAATPVATLLAGDWKGSGTAYLNILGDISVACDLKAKQRGQAIVLNGVCRKGPFSRRLDMTLVNTGGGSYSGTYSGTRDGNAKLNGQMTGGNLSMAIAWPKEVNGDRAAAMVLRPNGPDGFSLTVRDKVDGRPRVTSRFSFKRV